MPKPIKIERPGVACGNCFFAEPAKVSFQDPRDKHAIPKTQIVLFCRRNPPVIASALSSQPYPIVDQDKDWCGEFSHYSNYIQEDQPDGQTPSQEGQEKETVPSSQVQADQEQAQEDGK